LTPEATPLQEQKKLDAERVLQSFLRPIIARRRFPQAELTSLLEAALQKVLEVLCAEVIATYAVREDGRIYFHSVGYSKSLGVNDSKVRERWPQLSANLETLSMQKGQGVVGKVIETREPYITYPTLQDQDFREDLARKAGFDVRSILTIPLVVGLESIGALQVMNKCGDDLFSAPDFSPADLEFLLEVAPYLAIAVRKSRLTDPEFSDREVASFVARLARLEFFDIPEGWKPDEKLWNRVGEHILRKFLILPLEKVSAKGIKAAMVNPFDVQARDSFLAKTGLEIEQVVVASARAVNKAIRSVFEKEKGGISTEEAKKLLARTGLEQPVEQIDVLVSENEESDGIIQLANRIIEDAYTQGASDIHIEPFEEEVKVRFRVDGYLQEVMTFPTYANRALVSRYKIMTKSMDITENRLPQDGRIKFKEFTKTDLDIDLRVSTAPLAFGQKVVMRVLDKGNTALGLARMGFSEANLRLYREIIKKPYGMVLHVGPTGSGKTTTLYSALSELNRPDTNIQTAEDPIEYMLPNVNQMQIHKEIGLTFASALRCFLRQDPDIILVGEIRDSETGEIAVEAALTGHLIFSTLHTNDAPGTVSRLIDMGIEPFLVSSGLLMVCAQRLTRRLCPKCKVEYLPTVYECRALGIEAPQPVYAARPEGCPHCKGAGYRGRIGVHEIMTLDDEMKSLIGSRAPAEELRDAAIRNGMIPLYADAMEKVLQGITSLEEAISTVRKD